MPGRWVVPLTQAFALQILNPPYVKNKSIDGQRLPVKTCANLWVLSFIHTRSSRIKKKPLDEEEL